MRTVQDLTTAEVQEVNVRLNEYGYSPVFQAEVDTRMEVLRPVLMALPEDQRREAVENAVQTTIGNVMQEQWLVIVTDILSRDES